MKPFNVKEFALITLLTSLWIHASEVFRYFVIVMPKIRQFFRGRSGIAEMDWGIFSIWGAWDILLTAILVWVFWLISKLYGNNLRSIFLSGTLVWASIFVIFWVAAANMGLSNWSLLLIVLPLSWFEMVIGSWIASRLYMRKSFSVKAF